jgi:hypothetical protein
VGLSVFSCDYRPDLTLDLSERYRVNSYTLPVDPCEKEIHMPRSFIIIFVAVSLFSPALSNRDRQENKTPTPHSVLENDYVRISKVYLHAGSQSPYTVPAGLAAVVVRLRFIYGLATAAQFGTQGYSLDRVMFLNAGESSKDVQTSSISGVLEARIELKSLPPASPFEKDAVAIDPSHNKVLFENDRVRVVDVHFGLGEKGPVVDKRPRVIILVNDMHADVAKHEGDTLSPRDGKSGVIQWSLGGSQATMNRNETKLDNIVVEIKGK